MPALKTALICAALFFCAATASLPLQRVVRDKARALYQRAVSTLHKELRAVGASDHIPMCLPPNSNDENAVVSVLFASEAQCELYRASPVYGSPIGQQYSNCSSAAYCLGSASGGTAQFVGYDVVGLAALNVGSATVTFGSKLQCEIAANRTLFTEGAYTTCTPQAVLRINGLRGNFFSVNVAGLNASAVTYADV